MSSTGQPPEPFPGGCRLFQLDTSCTSYSIKHLSEVPTKQMTSRQRRVQRRHSPTELKNVLFHRLFRAATRLPDTFFLLYFIFLGHRLFSDSPWCSIFRFLLFMLYRSVVGVWLYQVRLWMVLAGTSTYDEESARTLGAPEVLRVEHTQSVAAPTSKQNRKIPYMVIIWYWHVITYVDFSRYHTAVSRKHQRREPHSDASRRRKKMLTSRRDIISRRVPSTGRGRKACYVSYLSYVTRF